MFLASMEVQTESLVLPGDVINIAACIPSATSSDSIVVGPGLKTLDEGALKAVQPGILRFRNNPPTFWLDVMSQRYVPLTGDRVVGLVTQRLAEGWKVDIGAVEQAVVPYLSFEGATKRNRPNVNVGDLLYCQVAVALRDMEPEVTCVDSLGKARGMGVLLPDGLVISVPVHVSRKLLSPDFPFLATLGKRLSFEVVIGNNGRIYIKAHNVKDVIAIANVLVMCQNMDSSKIDDFVSSFVDKLAGF